MALGQVGTTQRGTADEHHIAAIEFRHRQDHVRSTRDGPLTWRPAWALGFSPHRPGGVPSRPGSTFGMAGANGSAAYADIDLGIAVAVMRNRFGGESGFAMVAEVDCIVADSFPAAPAAAPAAATSNRPPTIGVIMNEPLTELDARFSDPDAQATPWDTTLEVLESAQLAWVSTVRADGRPHVTPLVAVWLDGAFHFSTGPDEQKAVNLATNPHIVLTTGCNHWDRGLDVMVEGEARRVTDRATLERLAAAWATKWDGSWQFDVADDGFHHPTRVETPSSPEADGLAMVFAVEPTKVLAFGKGKGSFTHTRYLPADR